MATEIKLPRLGQGMESGTIVKWLKSEGESVQKGEPLYELDTDKVTQEVEADASGVLLKIAVQEGEVPVGRTIAVIGAQGETVAETSAETPGHDDEPGAAEDGDELQTVEKPSRSPARDDERERGRDASADPEPPSSPPSSEDGGRVKASPLARRIARERGVELAEIHGTGPDGRIVAEDVERAGAQAPAPAAAPTAAPAPTADVEIEQLTSMRRTIARRLTEAWEAPVFQISMTADMRRALELRGRLVEATPDGGVRPSVNDLLTKVCAVALLRHRAVNALYRGDTIELHPTANVGIAVAIEKGLVVPVISSAERRTIPEIAAVRADLVGRARGGKLTQADLGGGTFTISNLGMYGVERFVAVLNPPQAAILAVGSADERPVVEDGEIVARPTMELTLTCDHRAVDGATAAEFLRDVKTFLEEPGLAL